MDHLCSAQCDVWNLRATDFIQESCAISINNFHVITLTALMVLNIEVFEYYLDTMKLFHRDGFGMVKDSGRAQSYYT